MKYAITILFLSAGLSAAADDAESKKLLKNLEGTYKFVSGEQEGQVVEKEDPDFWGVKFVKVSLKGDKFTLIAKDKCGKEHDTELAGTITVDASKKPVHIDLDFKMGNQTQSASGITASDGESIKICFGDPADKKRPTDFKTTKDDKNKFVITLKKIKE